MKNLEKLFSLFAVSLAFSLMGCASNNIDPNSIPTDTVVFLRGKDSGYMPEMTSGRVGFKGFEPKAMLYFNQPRFDIYRQTKVVAENQGGSYTSTRRTVWKNEKENFEYIAFSLGEGLYVDTIGNVFLNPVEAFKLEGITKYIDKNNFMPKDTTVFEDNKLYACNKKGEKVELLAEVVNGDFISHTNAIFGKKKSVLHFNEENQEYIFEKEKGLSLDIPLRFCGNENSMTLTRKILKFVKEMKIVRSSGRIDIMEKDTVLVSMIRYENAIIVQETENSGRILWRNGNIFTETKYGNR